jgi:glycyl-tRNA synthetase beta chain
MVGEFPELQGVMGRYYALHDREDADVADAIRDHYKPLGPNDAVPTNKVSIAVALADKLDQLVGFFAVGERPSGSGDQYAVRRSTLGAVRTTLERQVRLSLIPVLARTARYHAVQANERASDSVRENLVTAQWLSGRTNLFEQYAGDFGRSLSAEITTQFTECIADVLEFIDDRLKVALREKGTRHDLIDAVFSLGNEDDLVRLVARVEALQAFLKTDDGANLLVAYRRAANILRDEEKRDKTSYDGEPNPELFAALEEKALFVELATASELIRAEVERDRFVEAMGVMARLRKPVDAFFERVTVNDKNPDPRKNRLKLLSRLRTTLHLVADFSKIEG